MNKNQWRIDIKEKLNSISEKEKERQTERTQIKLFESKIWINASVIGTTISVGNELDTINIIKQAWAENKKIVVPKCETGDKQLNFFEITSFDDVENSFYGLKEPNPAVTKESKPAEIDLLLVPGLIFDRKGYRIGYGGGYYDRFLQNQTMKTCSLCYVFQLKEELPHDSFDIPVERIITQDETVII